LSKEINLPEITILKRITILIYTILFSVIFAGISPAQDSTRSLAFKNNKPFRRSPYFYRPDLGYQIWQQFKLTQEANSGDVLAQHELGLRYLLGEGMTADTTKAVYWLNKAADQKLPSAMYNYAILLINGWGVDWNPFSAFNYFKGAAKAGMIQAQYVVGILYTDNLIVKRDLNYAFYWVQKSADEGYEPAEDVVLQIEPKISQSIVDSISKIEDKNDFKIEKDIESEHKSNLTSPVDLVFIEFDSIGDTITSITDSMLISDLSRIGIDSLLIKMDADSITSLTFLVSPENVDKLFELAENGSPEAQTIIGKLYEEGIYFRKDLITAAAYYFRALRIDSPKARYLLWQLSKSTAFLERVQRDAKNDDSEAMFVWYGLNSINYDNQLVIDDAINLLQKSADDDYIPAMIELGLNYYTGRYTLEDKSEGLQFWEDAASIGSTEARVRLITASLYSDTELENPKSSFDELIKASENGSLLAQVGLAHCYQNGIGTAPSKGETVNYYRVASQRGSQYAYRELQRLYDEIRPDETEFSVN
jgi:TPR repeat protein